MDCGLLLPLLYLTQPLIMVAACDTTCSYYLTNYNTSTTACTCITPGGTTESVKCTEYCSQDPKCVAVVAESITETSSCCLVNQSAVPVTRGVVSVIYYRPGVAFHCRTGWREPGCNACAFGYRELDACASCLSYATWESDALRLILTFSGDNCTQITGFTRGENIIDGRVDRDIRSMWFSLENGGTGRAVYTEPDRSITGSIQSHDETQIIINFTALYSPVP